MSEIYNEIFGGIGSGGGGVTPEQEMLLSQIPNKQDKVIPSSVGNIQTLDVTGNTVDSGKKFNDVGTTINDILTAAKTIELINNASAGKRFIDTWDASTNTPTLPLIPLSTTYKQGDYYDVIIAGTFDGIDYSVGDRIIVAFDFVGDALIWVKEDFNQNATQISYDNATSSLLATNVQEAIDELNIKKLDAVLTSKNIANQVSNYTIPTLDVDNFNLFIINQTTPGILYQIGTPTGNATKMIFIANTGTVNITLFSTIRITLQPNTVAVLTFNGANWNIQSSSQWITEATGVTFPSIPNETNNIWLVRSSNAVGSGAVLPTITGSVRSFFYPRKAAFRAGEIDGTQWNDGSIGTHSVGTGYNTRASGNYSQAHGFNAVSTGVLAIALGENATASGNYSFALGQNTSSTGNNSVSIGFNTTAQAFASLVAGQWNVLAGATNSWVATDPLFVVGNGTGGGTRNNAIVALKNGSVMLNNTTGNLQSSPNTSAILDLVSTDKGFLPPRMTTAQRNAIVTPANGLIVFDTTANSLYVYQNSSWQQLTTTLNTLPYTQTFNATTDWGAASGGFYTITILSSTHGKGTTPTTIQNYELVGSDYKQIIPNIIVNSSGNVLIQVPDVPDSRFAGKISINF